MRNTSKTKNSIGTNFKLIKLCDCFNFLAFLFLSSCLQMTNSKTMTDDFNFIAHLWDNGKKYNKHIQ